MKKTPYLFLHFLFLSLCLNTYAGNNSYFIKKTAIQFSKQWNRSQQEKLYLHTDKPYYSAGEKIWFKGYLVNATTHLPTSLSKFIYVELINKANEVIARNKIKADSIGFDGYISLEPNLPMGNYAIRAYTYWMQNADVDFFFRKDIYIGNAIDDYTKSNITYVTNKDGKISATMSFTDANNKPLVNKKINITQSWNSSQNTPTTLTTDKNGKINTILNMDSASKATNIIEVNIDEENLRYKNKFYIPEFSYDYDIQFFAESGNLLAGQIQTLGFKAIGANGLAINVTGKVFNSKNEEVSNFITTHLGMGKISLMVDSAETYYAITTSESGIEKKINLPKATPNAIALQLNYNRGKVWYNLLNNSNVSNENLFLLIHSRGKMLAALPLAEPNGQIIESKLPAGIVTFSVIDTLFNYYCERLYFARNPLVSNITSQNNKTEYGKREPVEVIFNVTANGEPAIGNFSLSITDKKLVTNDSTNDNIVSNLLLTSDIKGYVEKPGSYFSDSIKQDHERLDALMLTQGWRRFNTADVLKGNLKNNDYYMEVGQALSGKVIDVLKKPSKGARVIMICDSLKIMKSVLTDSLGQYYIDGLNFNDSIYFNLKAKKGKIGFPDLTIIPDQDVFPKFNSFIPLQRPENLEIPNEYYIQTKSKYFWEGGERLINLDAVTVKGKQKSPFKKTESYTGSQDKLITSNDLKDFLGMPIWDYLQTLPGVTLNGDELSLRGSRGMPLLLVNGIESANVEDFKIYSTDMIENIMIFYSTKGFLFGSRGGNGAIAIELKSGERNGTILESSRTIITRLGVQKPAEFYTPKYETTEARNSYIADLRTTIYWNPKLVSDSTGVIKVKFYTADKANDYTITLEGLTKKGEICRYTGIINRKKE